MSGKVRHRGGGGGGATDNITLSVNERILKDCHKLYTAEDNGNTSHQHKLPLALLTIRILGFKQFTEYSSKSRFQIFIIPAKISDTIFHNTGCFL